ncbi:hypothetical protein GUJ93_ZPchr0003g17060 [Zizania palustris]|uniref:Uncharacterized protein n=1 Tax=Zizania palustris TaxID=103762 RepID=A0A8J5VJK9_ZIZPA|nr:hypothetical protein GUJ93_ZPchr0003g17060 [Zizania palustris]
MLQLVAAQGIVRPPATATTAAASPRRLSDRLIRACRSIKRRAPLRVVCRQPRSSSRLARTGCPLARALCRLQRVSRLLLVPVSVSAPETTRMRLLRPPPLPRKFLVAGSR